MTITGNYRRLLELSQLIWSCPPSPKQLSEVQMEKLQCPHCSQQLGKQESSYASGPADPNSSEVLFSHLRAMWNSQITTTNGDPRTRIEQFSQYESNWT